MADQIQIDVHHAHHSMKCEYNTKTLHRIRRIQGQLAGLEKMIEADEGSCEERVIRARTIEKGMTNLITHLVECYLVNTARPMMAEDPDTVAQDITRIFDLLNR
ncbi:MAG: metal-sensitive transcriptional regulator [Anaerolineae bacterium]|nr:metal-sensitive transcriptional regulator [Anaerolineae bacterium]